MEHMACMLGLSNVDYLCNNILGNIHTLHLTLHKERKKKEKRTEKSFQSSTLLILSTSCTLRNFFFLINIFLLVQPLLLKKQKQKLYMGVLMQSLW